MNQSVLTTGECNCVISHIHNLAKVLEYANNFNTMQ